MFQAAVLPAGLAYAPDFIDPGEEAGLLERIRTLPLEAARYRQYTARRRTASFGWAYDFETSRRTAAPPMPAFLEPLRERVACWTGEPGARFVQALVTEYRPGSALGWHRDVPEFEAVVGISLGAPCRMRFRPWPTAPGRRPASANRQSAGPVRARAAPFELWLEPCSAYVLRGAARWGWQHGIAPTKALRYSITFRTLRAGGNRDP